VNFGASTSSTSSIIMDFEDNKLVQNQARIKKLIDKLCFFLFLIIKCLKCINIVTNFRMIMLSI